MSRRKRHGGGHAEGGGGHGGGEERWMASYMDMVTVLMCLFIVLYAMSTVDAQKWENLKLALATGFGQTPTNQVDTATGIVVPENLAGDAGPELGYAGYAPQPTEVTELGDLQALASSIQQQLQAAGVDASGVEYEVTGKGLTIKMTGAQTFFDGNSARLRPDAVAVLNAIGPTLAAAGRDLSIEGHADPRYNPAPYQTTWELAAARATSVLRYLVESCGVSGDTISGTTYGSSNPVSDDATQNRRVDIVILSDDPEKLQSELDAQSAGTSGAGTTTQSGGTGSDH